ncbi:MAG: DnaD domain-containing protein [Chloroflexota bacterium]
MAFLPIPAPLLGPLLQEIDTLSELKLVLHLWRRLHETKRSPRYALMSEVRADRALILALQSGESGNVQVALDDALRRALERKVFLQVEAHRDGHSDFCILLNTPTNQRLAEQIQSGEVVIPGLGVPQAPAAPAETRPTVYALYEENIGLLTPLVAQELKEAELTYPAEWIEDAFREAVGYNKRNWRYIRRILENWGVNGRGAGPRGEPGRDTQPPQDPRAYLSGKFGRYVKH